MMQIPYKIIVGMVLSSIPFLLLCSYFISDSIWVNLPGNLILPSIASGLLIFHVLLWVLDSRKIISVKVSDQLQELIFCFRKTSYLCIGVVLALAVVLPIRSLRLGDGIILLENIKLESEVFGAMYTIDEFIEAFLHSKLYLALSVWDKDPRTAYRIISTVCGFLFSGIFYFFFRDKFTFASTLLFLSGGFFLFFGYSENYSIMTLSVFLFLSTSYNWLKKGKGGLIRLLVLTAIAIFAVLNHLVAGYLIFALVYLAFVFSKNKSEFAINSLVCSVFGISILGGFIAYLVFYANTQVDLMNTNIAHPMFYPLKKIISMKHFTDLLQTALFSCMAPFFILLGEISGNYGSMKLFFQRKENRLLLAIAIGFLFHAFSFHPLLGYPADWDIISFYWVPVSIIAILYLSEYRMQIVRYLPLILLHVLFFVVTLNSIKEKDEKLERELLRTLSFVEEFSSSHKRFYQGLNPDRKKSVLKIHFFLEKSAYFLNQSDCKDKHELLQKKDVYLKTLLEWKQSHPGEAKEKAYYNELSVYNGKYLACMKNYP